MALNLEADNVGVVIFGSDPGHQGTAISSSGPAAIVDVPVGPELLGARRSTRLGNPMATGKGPIKAKEPPPRGRQGTGHHARASRCMEPISTRPQGHRRADPRPRAAASAKLVPCAGPTARTGKTAIILDTILNQKAIHDNGPEGEKLYCDLCRDGQKRSTVAVRQGFSKTAAR